MKNLEFYTQPFHQPKYGSWVYDSRSNFVFQFEKTEAYDSMGNYAEGVEELRQEVIFSLNSINHEPINSLNLSVNEEDGTEILNGGKLFITIRGWGNLTGIGGHNFGEAKAVKIQDDFRDWLIYKLSNKTI